MKTRTQVLTDFGWFEMSKIWHISNLKRNYVKSDIPYCFKIDSIFSYFTLMSEDESKLLKIEIRYFDIIEEADKIFKTKYPIEYEIISSESK